MKGAIKTDPAPAKPPIDNSHSNSEQKHDKKYLDHASAFHSF